MRTHLRIIILCLLTAAYSAAFAQNCTINAGVPTRLCPFDEFILKGTSSGLIKKTGVWKQVSGPAVTIVNPNSLTTKVTGYAPGNTYKFRLTATCTDGAVIYDEVTYETLVASTANAGVDINACPGTIQLNANSPGANETGVWSIVGLSRDSIYDFNAPATQVKIRDTPAAVSTYRWTITNTNGCLSRDELVVRNSGGRAVNAGPDIVLNNCYSVSHSVTMHDASYGGDITGNPVNGQFGTWTLVSGPTVPTFENIHNNTCFISDLYTGTYVFRWTVVGPCFSGSDEVTVTVPPPTQSVTASYNIKDIFCDSRNTTIVQAPQPKYVNEVFTWTKNWGDGNITDIHSPTATVTGLVGNSVSFNYEIRNTVTNCATLGQYEINFVDPAKISTPPVITAICGATSTIVPITADGGGSAARTRWALIGAPAGSFILNGGIGNFWDVGNLNMLVEGMDVTGDYRLRYKRTTESGTGGCIDAYADVLIRASKAPTASNAGTRQILACNVTETNLAGNVPSVGTGSWSQISGPNTATMADKTDPTTLISGLISGEYKFRWIITGNVGCTDQQSDVSVFVSLATPTVAYAGVDETICSNTPYTLKGNSPVLNESGTWTVVTPSAGGVTFSDVNDPQATISGMSPNTTYTFKWTITNPCSFTEDEVSITTSAAVGPKQAQAGNDVCLAGSSTSFVLSGNEPTGIETGAWTVESGPSGISFTDATQYNTTVTNVTDGTYTLVWTLSTPNGCAPSIDKVTFTVSDPATTAVAGTEITVCAAGGVGTATMAANAAIIGTGKWSQLDGPGGVVITDPSNPVTTITNMGEGRYTFRWTISNGVCAENYSDVKVNVYSKPTDANSGGNMEICDAATATLHATPVTTGTGLWSQITGPGNITFSSFSDPNASLSGLIYGDYVIRWTTTNSGNCTSTSDMTLKVTGKAVAVTKDVKLCNLSTANLIGNERSTGKWTLTSGTGVTVTDNTSNTAIATGMVAGNTYQFTYTIPATANCPQTTDVATVAVSELPSTADAGADQTNCILLPATTGTVNLSAVVPTKGTGTWSYAVQPNGSSPALSNDHAANATLSNLANGVYLLNWTVANGACADNIDVVRVSVYLEPSNADAGTTQTDVCAANVVLKGNTPAVGIGTWTLVSGPNTPVIDAPNSPETRVLGTIQGTYEFKWTISNGSCTEKSDNVSVTVSSMPASDADANVGNATIQALCNTSSGASAPLHGNAPVALETGLWTVVSSSTGAGVANFTNATVATTNINNLSNGTYLLRWTLTNGSCHTSDTVSLNVFNDPSNANAGAPKTVCLYSPVILQAASPVTNGTGAWSFVSGTSTPVITPVDNISATVTGLGAGVYNFLFTTSNGVCTPKTSPVVLTVEDCSVQVVKTASTPELQADGSYNVTFKFVVTNPNTTANVKNAQVSDNLRTTFPLPKTFTKVSLSATGTLASSVNAAFDGETDINLLNAATAVINHGSTETITLVVNVKL
ncbi:hypothetical protein HNQ91_004691 [Filimonas zeae]|uniref:hypothetical protein n=1 Tax=Filimonas zeae TaxID=1737353 RepID=UPI00166F1864|nr:hypothetical protein [Filimonas zeae]MDR6341618.1 hypothetical protein [Filimonas zeae]